MGVTYVDVTVRSSAHQSRAWTGAFLADTGAIDSLVLRRSLGAIGLKPTGRRHTSPPTTGKWRWTSRWASWRSWARFRGESSCSATRARNPCLGVTALESAGIAVDPQNQRIKRLLTVRLRGLRHIQSPSPLPRECQTQHRRDGVES